MSPRLRERTRLHQAFTRRRYGALAAALLAVAALAAETSPAGAVTTEQGTIALHSLVTLSPYPCGSPPCLQSGIHATSSGYLIGLDSSNHPYDVEWSAPEGGLSNMTLSLEYWDFCTGWPQPSGDSLAGSFSIAGAVVYHGGLSQNATVTGSFSAARDTKANLAAVGQLYATVWIGSTAIDITIDNAAGLLDMTPVGTDLCSSGTTSQEFTIDGTLLTLL
jgi:hypothetical protein